MLGAICGDIVGSIYEWEPIKTKEFELFTDEKYFTDDSVMTVAVGKALLSITEYTEENVKNAVIQSMKTFGNKYNDVGYGGMFRRWLFLKDEGKKPYNSCGNGSAMRTSAIGWMFNSLEQTRQVACWVAEVTHNHPEGIKGAEAVSSAIYLARNGYTKKEIQDYVTKEFYSLNATCNQIRPLYKFDATCQGTVPQAIQAFLEGTSFEDVVRNAISLGGDSDTLTCIAASMAEAAYDIPVEIKNKICTYLPEEFISILKNFYERDFIKHPNPYDEELVFAFLEDEDFSQNENIKKESRMIIKLKDMLRTWTAKTGLLFHTILLKKEDCMKSREQVLHEKSYEKERE